MNEPGTGGWLTAKRLRGHGILLAACLWSLYAWNLATPGLRDRASNLKGTDFLHFYTLGTLALTHDAKDLYDMNAQAALAAQHVPQAAGIRYLPLYPPQVSMFFAPLAHFPYASALALWWVCSAVVYGVSCFSVWRACLNLRSYGSVVLIAALAFPAFFHLIAWGQTSALALACFTLMFFLLRDQHEWLAGLALGCLIFKPQLGLAAAVVFLSCSAWKVLAGAAISAAAQLSVGVVYYGMEPLRHWVGMILNAPAVLLWLEPKPYQTHCLRTFWSMLIPWNDLSLGLYVLSAAIVLSATVMIWRNSAPLTLRYPSLLLATVLVAPHLTVYDLVVLAPALLLLADWLASHPAGARTPTLGTLLYLVYMLPLLGLFTRWTHVQLSVIAMSASVYAVWRASRSTPAAT